MPRTNSGRALPDSAKERGEGPFAYSSPRRCTSQARTGKSTNPAPHKPRDAISANVASSDPAIRTGGAQHLAGWAGYFRHGNSARCFDKLQAHARTRIAIFLSIKHQRERWWGERVVYDHPTEFGLYRLVGTVQAPCPTPVAAPTKTSRMEENFTSGSVGGSWNRSTTATGPAGSGPAGATAPAPYPTNLL
ncbi:MAG: group II intron maturase-specific domain-containing protein, partial [Acidimicrobiales bacterium]